MMDVKQTSIKLPKEMLIKIKALAVEKETTQNNIIREALAEYLNISGKSNKKIKAKIIQMPFIDPDDKGNFKDNAGIVEIEDPENLDVNELIDSIHYKKELY